MSNEAAGIPRDPKTPFAKPADVVRKAARQSNKIQINKGIVVFRRLPIPPFGRFFQVERFLLSLQCDNFGRFAWCDVPKNVINDTFRIRCDVNWALRPQVTGAVDRIFCYRK